MFEFQVKINFSPKHRNIRTGKNIARNQIDCSVPELLTPRMVLSQVSSIYDPLGLATPFTLAAKVLMSIYNSFVSGFRARNNPMFDRKSPKC
jgi:hypothetical protein